MTTGSDRIAGMPLSGTGLLAVFCDLAEEWRADFRPWLAEDMFPPRKAIGFGPGASFDLIASAIAPEPEATPQAYVTCYVTPTLGDLYGIPYQSLRKTRAPRDAAYHQRMRNQARTTAAWVGPGIESAEPAFAAVMVIDRFDLAAEDAQAFNIWYATEYLPACTSVSGLRRLRRYRTMEGTPGHLVTYEFASEDDLASPQWRALRAADAWHLCRFAPGAPAAYRKVIEAAG